jgi:hypothetical protein
MSETCNETPRRDAAGRLKPGATMVRAMSARLRRLTGLWLSRRCIDGTMELGLGGACHGQFRFTV